jgi:SpoVK/Ycf46/Vps4 family AAA+-type ATPase
LRQKFRPPGRINGNGQNDTNQRSNTNRNNNGRSQINRPSSSGNSGGGQRKTSGGGAAVGAKGSGKQSSEDEEELPEELQHLDKELVLKIQNEIMESGETVQFDDIAGLKDAKQTVMELVVWPMMRPEVFTGLRRAPNGLLLFGPPVRHKIR